MTLGVSLRIKCIVAAPHTLWPRGMFWSVELMLQSYGSWVSRWFSVFWALVFKFFPFTFFKLPIITLSVFFSDLSLWFFSDFSLWFSSKLVLGRTFYISFWGMFLSSLSISFIFWRRHTHTLWWISNFPFFFPCVCFWVLGLLGIFVFVF